MSALQQEKNERSSPRCSQTPQASNPSIDARHQALILQTKVVSRRLFIVLLQLVHHDIPRNTVWREFVPLVKESSEKLTRLQAYMLAHQGESTLATLHHAFLSDIECCMADLERMIKKLKTLRDICKNGG